MEGQGRLPQALAKSQGGTSAHEIEDAKPRSRRDREPVGVWRDSQRADRAPVGQRLIRGETPDAF